MPRMNYNAPVQQVTADDNKRFALMQREVITEANKLGIDVVTIHGDFMEVSGTNTKAFSDLVLTAYNNAYCNNN